MTAQSERVALTGNEAGALAMRQSRPDVVAGYPITPQTELMQQFAQYVADGASDTELILVESEHSAMSAVVGAAATGVRAMTATSANGLAFMWEMLFIAAGYRLPIVMQLVSRSLGGPLNIHCDHSDAMGARETGWLQFFAENAQEAYDNALMAVRIAEHPEVLLPVMTVQDGFITSHTTQVLETLDDETVSAFVGTYRPTDSLSNLAKPMTYGAIVLPDYYMEVKRQQVEAMDEAPRIVALIEEEYADLTGRRYESLDPYRMDDAESAIVVLGSAAGTGKDAVDLLREQGHAVGLLKVRRFRPFPAEEVAQALSHCSAVGVLDRSLALGAPWGPLASDVASSLMRARANVPMLNYVYGLGGRDITVSDIVGVGSGLMQDASDGPKAAVRYVGVHE
ncbi:pyruvate ferredoxin oxidoreductase [Candidatus Poribacteria bacterium]|nr:pyruvate ferredoxin oxidoreductase [Candidatus Poribacteria bacterium]